MELKAFWKLIWKTMFITIAAAVTIKAKIAKVIVPYKYDIIH